MAAHLMQMIALLASLDLLLSHVMKMELEPVESHQFLRMSQLWFYKDHFAMITCLLIRLVGSIYKNVQIGHKDKKDVIICSAMIIVMAGADAAKVNLNH